MATSPNIVNKPLERQNGVNVRFRNVSYSIKRNFFSKEKVKILSSVNGEFAAGELIAIIGASGSGKSTLVNILTGFVTIGVQGEIYQNGKLTTADVRNKSCSYIMQNDNLHPLLTVAEVMKFACDFKLPKSVPTEDKQKRINQIVTSLGLSHCCNTLTSKMSGGERRRLSICVELIHNPSILYLDEPTSGLDDVNAKRLISTFVDLAREGRTIICTIHQPSASILQKFNYLYCLQGGCCTFQGIVSHLLPYLETFDPPLICPKSYNPADFFLDVSHGVYGNYFDSLVERCKNGAISFRGTNVTEKDVGDTTDGALQVSLDSQKSLRDSKNESGAIRSSSQNTKSSTEFVEMGLNVMYATSFFHQTKLIILRKYTMLTRDKQHTFTRLFINFMTAFCVGILYFKIGKNGKHSIDNFNFIFFTTLWTMYSSFCSMVIVFTNEMNIIIKEHFNRWYSVKSYYVATTIIDLPILVGDVSIYITISYLMTGQPLEWFRFGLFFMFAILNNLVSQSVAMLYSAFCKFEVAAIMGPITLTPFITFCGYIVHVNDSPNILRWAFDCTFLRYSLEGTVQAIFGFGRGKLECPELYCHFANPMEFMKQVGMDEPRILVDVYVLVLHYVFLKLAAYLALRVRIGGKR